MMQEGFDVDWLVKHGYAADLLAMLIGENEYADQEAFETMDRHSSRLRSAAIRHLEFIMSYGNRTHPMHVDGKIISPCPEYFEAWKLAGCPGLSLYQLDRLVKSKR